MANEKGHPVPPSAAATRFVNIASAMTAAISAKTPPNQGVRDLTEPFKIAAFRASNNFSPLPAALQGSGNGGFFPVPRDCGRLATSVTRCEVTTEDHDHNV